MCITDLDPALRGEKNRGEDGALVSRVKIKPFAQWLMDEFSSPRATINQHKVY